VRIFLLGDETSIEIFSFGALQIIDQTLVTRIETRRVRPFIPASMQP
jgi:hypothetical protein